MPAPRAILLNTKQRHKVAVYSFIDLPERQRDRETFHLWFTPQRPTTVRAGPSQRQEQSLIGSPTQVARIQVADPFAASQVHLCRKLDPKSGSRDLNPGLQIWDVDNPSGVLAAVSECLPHGFLKASNLSKVLGKERSSYQRSQNQDSRAQGSIGGMERGRPSTCSSAATPSSLCAIADICHWRIKRARQPQ